MFSFGAISQVFIYIYIIIIIIIIIISLIFHASQWKVISKSFFFYRILKIVKKVILRYLVG